MLKHFFSFACTPGRAYPAALLALSLGLAPDAFGQGTFSAPAQYGSGGTKPIGISAGDLNGDGRPDLVVDNFDSNPGNAGVLLNVAAPAAAGTFPASATTYLTGGTFSAGSAIGDVDGDGRRDIIVSNIGNNTVGVLLNAAAPAASGTFPASATTYPTGGQGPIGLALGDVNGDGRPDIVAAHQNGTTVTVLLNALAPAPAGTFSATPVSYVVGNNPYTARLGDLNGDGQLDIVTSNFSGGSVSVLLNSATNPGTFSAAVSYSSGGSLPLGMVLGDVNGDGRLDIVANHLGSTVVGVLLNSATTPGTFGAPATYNTGGTGEGLDIGDVNGDGRLDLVVARGSGSSSVGVLVNAGTGTFPTVVGYTTGGTPFRVVLTDVNGDGLLDMATNNASTNGVSVLRNTSFIAAPILTSVNPTSGPVGTSVTLTGTNLTAATGVSFNGTPATTFAVVDATTVTAIVPAGASTGDVTVTTGGGTSNGVTFTLITDLVISDERDIQGGSYRNITIQDGGLGKLAGDITVSGDFLIEDGGTLYTFSGNNSCQRISGAGSFTLAAGGYLEICDADGIALTGATGTIRSTGPRSFSNDASYDYTAAEAQVTGSGLPATVRELYSFNDFDVTLTQAVAIRQLLEPAQRGNIQLNGQVLTLLSDANGTALVVNNVSELTGNVLGRVFGATATVQRYLDPSLNPGLGYRHYSAPVSGSTVADLATAGFMPEVSQARAYNLSATPGRITPFPTVFAYDQDRVTMTSTYTPFDRGFFVLEGSEGPGLDSRLEVGEGYAVQIAGTEKVDFTGTLNTGDIDVNLSRIGENADAGWALVGNPYPAPIDGSVLFGGENAPGLDQSFYVVESTGPYTGMYRAYARNFEGDEQNPLIATGQGFFVRVNQNSTSGQLQFRNNQRVTSFATQVNMYRGGSSAQPTVALTLRGATGPVDKLFVYADAKATPAFDSGYDAWKLSNSTGLNLSSRSAQDQGLSIDGRPAFTSATRIALAVGVPVAGTYTLSAASLKHLPVGLDAYLSDAATGQTLKLTSGTSYSFSVTAAQSQALLTGRFTLSFSTGSALASASGVGTAEQVSVYPNPATGRFTVTLPAIAGSRTVEATLLNSLGQVVRRQSASLNAGGTHFDVRAEGLSAGVYSLRLTAGATTLTKRVVLQ